MRSLRFLLLAVSVLSWHAATLAEGITARVGTVVFSLGDARLTRAGAVQALAKGTALQVGDALQTGGNGHVQLRMDDEGFISIKPNSRFIIDDYVYDPGHPEQNKVHFTLLSGQARSVTGKAGEVHKQGFRLNTPIAAIGIRGTDFVTTTDNGVTRVSVNRGAIVMSPFSEGCRQEALGACQTANARSLTASMKNMYLELNSNELAPRLVPTQLGSDRKPKRTSDNSDNNGSLGEAKATLAADQVQALAAGVTTPAPPPPGPAQITWGRWSQWVSPTDPADSSVDAVLNSSREPTFGNQVFALLRTKGFWELPSRDTGTVTFNYAAGEAVVVKGNQLAAASISNPKLSIDFNNRTFATSLTVNAGQDGTHALSAAGTVQSNGFLRGGGGSMQVLGTLAPSLNEAGYVFSHDLGNANSIQGVTRWQH